MIDHLSTYTTQYDVTKAFYESVFKPLGASMQMEMVASWNKEFPEQRMCAFGPDESPVFWLIEVKTPYTPRHVAFTANTNKDVDTFYQNGLQSGGEDNGKPGLRPIYHASYYGAFLIDPDGNNVEAVCHGVGATS